MNPVDDHLCQRERTCEGRRNRVEHVERGGTLLQYKVHHKTHRWRSTSWTRSPTFVIGPISLGETEGANLRTALTNAAFR
jgi:hypothetical protein